MKTENFNSTERKWAVVEKKSRLTLDKFIVDFDFDILEVREVAFDTKDRFEMLCVFDNPTPRFSANEVSDIRDP